LTDRDLNEPNERSPTAPTEQPAEGVPPPDEAADAPDAADGPAPDDVVSPGPDSDRSRRRILIGSQRDPGAYSRRRLRRDWEPVEGEGAEEPEQPPEPGAPEPPQPEPQAPQVQAPAASPPLVAEAPAQPAPPAEPEQVPGPEVPVAEVPPREPAGVAVPPAEREPVEEELLAEELPIERVVPAAGSSGPVPLPNLRQGLTPDLEEEFQAALGDAPVEELLSAGESAGRETLEPDARHTGRVVAVQRDDVFLELGGREQGCLPLAQLEKPPAVGDEIEVVVGRFNTEDGLYELRIPEAAVDVDDWADIEEGMVVEARVTGHNTGGLECQVNQIRGFIPISQVALYRVEDLAEFVEQKFPCLVTEANPRRRNLVLSRRAVLEREREEAQERLWDSLAPGQVHEGVVRKLMDFGAFVDLGGVDGLLHVSQLSWGRVNHPSEVLSEGQTIRVKIEKIDRESRRIGLAYREMLENPWETAAKKFPEGGVFEGTVTKLMDFGAFVEMEPGIEGLVHISELSHRRVWRASDVVKEGDRVEVLVLSVDAEAQRMSLSMKQLHQPEPEKGKGPDSDEPGPSPEPAKKRPRRTEPLQGGLGRSAGGEQFGLKW